MFIFQNTITANLVDARKRRNDAWAAFDAAAALGKRDQMLKAANTVAAVYATEKDPAVVREVQRLVDFMYERGPDGSYRQKVARNETIFGLVNAVMVATSQCPEVRGYFFGDPLSSTSKAGLLKDIYQNISNTDEKTKISQKTNLRMAIENSAVLGAKYLAGRSQYTQDMMLSFGILLSSLKAGSSLNWSGVDYDPFKTYVNSLTSLLSSSNLNMVNTSAAILGRMNYSTLGMAAAQNAKAGLEAALKRDDLDLAARKTLQWALTGPGGLASVPSPTKAPPAVLDPTNFYDNIFGAINSSGQYQVLAGLEPTPLFMPVPMQLGADPATCKIYLDNLRAYFKNEANKVAASTPVGGLIEGDKISFADYAAMVLNPTAQALEKSSSEEIRALSGIMYEILGGNCGSWAKRVKVDYWRLSKTKQPGLFDKSGSRSISIFGKTSSFGSVYSGSVNVTSPWNYIPKSGNKSDAGDATVWAQPQNTFSTSDLGMTETETAYRRLCEGLDKYLRADNPNQSDYLAIGADFNHLIGNANVGEFIGTTKAERRANMQKAQAAAAVGNLEEAIGYLSPNSALLKDLMESGIKTDTRSVTYTDIGSFTARWMNPIAWNEYYNILGTMDNKYNWFIVPLDLDISTREALGALVQNKRVYEPAVKKFVDKKSVLWSDRATPYVINASAILIAGVGEVADYLRAFNIHAGMQIGRDIHTDSTKVQEWNVGLGSLSSSYGRGAEGDQRGLSYDVTAYFRPGTSTTFTLPDSSGKTKDINVPASDTYRVQAAYQIPMQGLSLIGRIIAPALGGAKLGGELTVNTNAPPQQVVNLVLYSQKAWDCLDFQTGVSPDIGSLIRGQPVMNQMWGAGRLSFPFFFNSRAELLGRLTYRKVDPQMNEILTAAGMSPVAPLKFGLEFSTSIGGGIQRNFGIGTP